MREFPDDILSELVKYADEVYSEYLSYSKSNLSDAVDDGSIDKWDVYESAVILAQKHDDVEMIKTCFEILENKKDYPINLSYSKYQYVKDMLKNNSSQVLLYYLQNNALEINDKLVDTYKEYQQSNYFSKNVASSVLDTYIFNYELQKKLPENLEGKIKKKI